MKMWKRHDTKKVGTEESYFELLEIKSSVNSSIREDHEVMKNALFEAQEVRRFEIGLFWTRANFFWLFIALLFTAYGVIVYNLFFDTISCELIEKKYKFYFFLSTLNFIGIILSYIWYAAIKSSRYWQKNWE